MYNELINKIKEYDSIVIARHIGVDPDALCSQLALRDSIKLTYPEKKVLAVGLGTSKFSKIGKLDKLENDNNTLLIVCDTPDLKRVDGINIDDYKYSIKIDHHPFIEKYCDLEIIEDDKTSASEVIMEIIDETELKCDSNISELLYMGIVSDSNRFLFDSTTSNTFALISKYLEKYPFSLSDAYQKIYIRPISEVRLEAYISLNMTITENGFAYIIITDELLRSFGADSASPANMINNFNYIDGIIVWATITEDVRNKLYRISIRSRGPVVNEVAEKYNGGGHKYAAGVRVKTKEEIDQFINDLDLELKKYNEKDVEVM